MAYRILMVLDHPFPPDARVENEARSLVEAGFAVTVLSLTDGERPARETTDDGVQIVRAGLNRSLINKLKGLSGSLPFFTWTAARTIQREARRQRVDALHMHDLYLFGAGLKAGRALGLPVVGDLHENWVEALKQYQWSSTFPGNLVVSLPRWEVLEKEWVNAVDELVVVIEEAADRNRALGVPEERITVVPNTIHRDLFDDFDTDPALVERIQSPLTITYTGGFDLHRGLSSVLQAMPHVLREVPEARLVLVGEGRIRPDLESEAEALGLGAAVSFEGWQKQELLKSYMLGSDVCLVPHLKTPHTDATIPHKLFHYMYLERPVVVSDCLPLQRIVSEVKCGVVYKAGNPEALAKAILEVHQDRDEAARMATRGREAVEERFHWDAAAARLLDLYRRLSHKG